VRARRTALAAALVLSGAALASAQSRIPANELPGRERERFIESPLERFLKPGPFVQPPVIEELRKPRKGAQRGKPKRKTQ
jgi:hypothetical protein